MTSETIDHADREHSDLVGGSSAQKRLFCPASYQMEQKLPPSDKRESSSYADEGSALHECMQYILENNVVDIEEVVGMTFGVSETSPAGYVMTPKLVKDAIVPCVEFFDYLDDTYRDEGGVEFIVEKRCQFPGIPGAFGTSDLIFRTDKRTGVVDWKFGVGVGVKAAYADPTTGEVLPNAQLMFYGRAAQNSHPEMFTEADGSIDPKRIVQLYIVQPRARDNEGKERCWDHRVVNVKELEDFRMLLVRKVAEAKGENPTLARGDHCKFAACKKICPAHTNPSFQLTQVAQKLKQRAADSTIVKNMDVDWSELYSELLDYALIAEAQITEIRKGAHAYLDAGEKIPGWKLVPKRPSTDWKDGPSEQQAVTKAIENGIDEDQCFNVETKSFAQLRDAIAETLTGTKKAAKEAAAAMLKPFTVTKSSGTTLALENDDREAAILASDVMKQLGSKLSALTGR